MALCIVLGMLVCFGCSSGKNVFVLLPDDDGHVGSFAISNEAGTQVVDQAGQSIVVTSMESVPSAPEVMTQDRIEEQFGAALAAQPLAPETFILYYKADGTVLTSASKNLFPKILETIKTRHSNDISVTGHADRTGSTTYNISLSRQRAEQVTASLCAQGVDPQTIETSSHGEGNPLIKTADNVREPRNRRVEVTVR